MKRNLRNICRYIYVCSNIFFCLREFDIRSIKVLQSLESSSASKLTNLSSGLE